MKNYIFIFVAALMLLGVQVSASTAEGLTLTVTGGSGSGTIEPGTVVNIVADAAPSGKVFDRWVINGGAPVLGSIYNEATTFTMPATATSITAVYMADGPYFDDCDVAATTNGTWVRSGTTLNTADKVQGTGCLACDQTVNTATTFFEKRAFTPVNTGATRENGIFRLRFWIEDPAALGAQLSIELRSGTELAAEHQWNVAKATVVAGWNNFNLPFNVIALASGNSGADLAAINYVRIYSSGSAGVKAKLDGLMIYDPTVTKVNPVVTWANPADVAVGTALSGTQLNATANVAGSFTYTPASATVLSTIETKELSVLYKPIGIHALFYNNVTKTASINVVAGPTAINDVRSNAISMYPNPLKINGALNIKVEDQATYFMTIYNMNGQTVFAKQMNGSQVMNVNGVLKSGAYLVNVVSAKFNQNIKLFVE